MLLFINNGGVKRAQMTLVPSTVVLAKATDTFGSLLGKISEEFCGETVEKVTILSSSKVDSHVVLWVFQLLK